MIHFPAGDDMDDLIPDEPQPVPPAAGLAPHSLPFRRPADHYASPASDQRPIFPNWVAAGCGWPALVFVVVLFLAGMFAPRSGSVLDILFGKIQDDITSHFARDVTAVQKAAFAAEMKTLRATASAGKLKLDRTEKLLHLATEVDSDEKINHAEADKLIAAVREVNQSTAE